MRKIAIIYNPQSGSGKAAKFAVRLSDYLNKEPTEVQIVSLETKKASDAYDFAKDVASQGYELIVAMGGDGTINQVVGGILDSGGKTTLGIIPLGSVNNFAQALNISTDLKIAMKNIISGQVKAVDIGKINNRYIISSMTLGMLADVAKKVTIKEKRLWGSIAFVKDYFTMVRKKRRYFLKITHDNGAIYQRTFILLVAMTESIGGMKNFTPTAKVDDGFFHLYLIPRITIGQIFKNLSKLMSGSIENVHGISYIKTSTIKITCPNRNRKVFTRIDGDPALELPARMKVIHKGINVIVPLEKLLSGKNS